MRLFRAFSLTVLFAALGATSAFAQQSSLSDGGHTLSSSALDGVLASHESAADQQRGQLADLLSRSDVRDVARDRGIDMERVESAAAGLSDSQVRAVAPLVETAMGEGGGDGLGTITIGAVTLIVILLVLILVT